MFSQLFTPSLCTFCVLHHHSDFSRTSDLIMMIKSSLFKKPGRKNRFLKYLGDFIASADIKLPPVPVSSRWNSWFECIMLQEYTCMKAFTRQRRAKGWLLNVSLN